MPHASIGLEQIRRSAPLPCSSAPLHSTPIGEWSGAEQRMELLQLKNTTGADWSNWSRSRPSAPSKLPISQGDMRPIPSILVFFPHGYECSSRDPCPQHCLRPYDARLLRGIYPKKIPHQMAAPVRRPRVCTPWTGRERSHHVVNPLPWHALEYPRSPN